MSPEKRALRPPCADTSESVTGHERVCPTTTPERHLLGEFPMTCYRCHLEADS